MQNENETQTPGSGGVGSSALLGFLRGKLEEAERALRCREESEAVWRSGDDASWALVARLHGGKPSTLKDRLATADTQGRIAAKWRHEVEMFRAAIAALLQPNTEVSDR